MSEDRLLTDFPQLTRDESVHKLVGIRERERCLLADALYRHDGLPIKGLKQRHGRTAACACLAHNGRPMILRNRTMRRAMSAASSDIHQRGLSTFDLAGKHGFLPDVHKHEQVGVGQRVGRAIEAADRGS
jgi:hypothetical protein